VKAVAKVAVNAAVVALNVVMTHLLLTVANKPRLPITTQPTSEPNALSKQSQQTPHRRQRADSWPGRRPRTRTARTPQP
jgi:hypothetical protein